MSQPVVKFQKKHPAARLPVYSSAGAAGADLFADFFDELGDAALDPKANVAYDLEPGERRIFKTGVNIELPPGYEAQIRPRSGLAAKHGIMVVNSPGTIDEDYRGEIGVILWNTSTEMFEIKHGDRIAQMVIKPVEQAIFVEVAKLSETVRGEGGYGSTGVSLSPEDEKIRQLTLNGFFFDTIEDFTSRCNDLDMVGRAAGLVSALRFDGLEHSHVTWTKDSDWLLVGSKEEVIDQTYAYLQEMDEAA